MFTPKQFTKAILTKKHAKRRPFFILAGSCEWAKGEVVEQIKTTRGVASANAHILWAPKDAQLSNELFTEYADDVERLLIVRADAEESPVLHRFLASPTPRLAVVVWLPHSRFKPCGELIDAAERVGWVLICRIMRRFSLTRWVETRLREQGLVCADGRALQMLLDRTGADRHVVAGEVEKLVLYVKAVGHELVTFKDVERSIFDHQSDDILDFLIAIAARNRVRALQLLGQLWTPDRGAGRGLLAVLTKRLRQIQRVHALLPQRPTVRDIGDDLGVNYYFVPTLLTAARNFKRVEIEKFMANLIMVGRGLFTMEGRFLFERAILDI